jgi:hypothetical protein
MTRRRFLCTALAAAFVLACLPGAGRAAMPQGDYTIELGGSQSVWLGQQPEDDEFCDGFEAGFGSELDSCSFSLFVDAKGKITGSIHIVGNASGILVTLDGPVKGKQKGNAASGITSLSFSAKLNGSASDGGANPRSVSAQIAFGGQIDAGGVLTGDWSYSLCAKGAACREQADAIAPETHDGDWTLDLFLQDTGGGQLSGEALATFADGSACSYDVSGKYSAKKDEASLKLSPLGSACSGTSLQLKRVRDVPPLEGEMKYKLFGSGGSVLVESH